MTDDEIKAVVRTPEFRRFHNGLRILRSIDCSDLEAMLSRKLEDKDWASFRDHPWLWFITASDRDAAHLWALIQARQPRELL